MSRLERLLERCETLKKRIKELESTPIDDYQHTVREIQLRSLRAELSQVGRKLNQLTLYKRDIDD